MISTQRVAAVALVGLLVAGCSAGQPPSAEDAVATSQVSVRDDVFEPDAVEVAAGTEVTWTWEGDHAHNVVADDFQSDTQEEGTFAHRFTEAGTYTYRCTLHGGMDGVVVVTAS